MQSETQNDTVRREAMGLLARARPDTLMSLWERFLDRPGAPDIQFRWIRQPEAGLVMVQGRMSGDGAAFNLGEMTITRCTVQTEAGLTGTAYVQGRSTHHARVAALVDAVRQQPEYVADVTAHVLDPLAVEEQARRAARTASTEQTKVDFFTLVRGED